MTKIMIKYSDESEVIRLINILSTGADVKNISSHISKVSIIGFM